MMLVSSLRSQVRAILVAASLLMLFMMGCGTGGSGRPIVF